MIENYSRKFLTCSYDYNNESEAHELQFDDVCMRINIAGYIREGTDLDFKKANWFSFEEYIMSSKLESLMQSLCEPEYQANRFYEWSAYEFGLTVEIGSTFSLLFPYKGRGRSQVEILSTKQDMFSAFPY